MQDPPRSEQRLVRRKKTPPIDFVMFFSFHDSLLPHIGSATLKTRMAMASLAADNLIEFATNQRAITPVD